MNDGHALPPAAASPPWPSAAMIRPSASPRRRRFPSAVASVGFAASLLAPVALIVSGVGRPVDSLVAGAMVFVAIIVATSRPARLPYVFFFYIVFNRLLRRLLDYSAQEFSSTPPTSLVVPVLGVLMCWAAVSQWKSLPKRLRRGSKLFFIALGYGAVVGITWGPSMVFELLSWLAPFGFGLYAAWLQPSATELKRWLAAFAIFAVLGTAYGWVQWLLLPPWDEFWVRNCGMGSIGAPQPMRCRFFGPFGAPGNAASAAVYGAIFLIITPCLPGTARAVMAGFLGLSSLVTGVRSTWLAGIATVVSWVALRRGGGAKILPLFLALAAGAFILPSLPGSEFATRRMNSLGDISTDSSLRGRLGFSVWALGQIATHPQGFGLGSTGLGSSRLAEGTLTAFDSGYLQPLYALGLPGGCLLILSLVKLIHPLMQARYWKQVVNPSFGDVTRAVIIGFAVNMFVANALRTDIACLFWMFVLMSHTAPRLAQPPTTRGSVAPPPMLQRGAVR
ncbi:MAG: hypothetical protein AAF266_01860 [Planctomycetota bacterium]